MSADNDDKNSQLDLGLTQILESLSEASPCDESISSPADSTTTEEVLDPKVETVLDSIRNQSLPIVLVVPQLLELFYGQNSFNELSKVRALDCAVEVISSLLKQDESLLADSVLAAIKNMPLSESNTDSLVGALGEFIDSSKNIKQDGFTPEDPKLLSARLSLLEFYRSLKPKTQSIEHSKNVIENVDKFEFAAAADRKIPKVQAPKVSRWIFILLILSVLIALYSIYLNKLSSSYEIADSDYGKNNSSASLVNDDSSIQRQDVSNLSALMYDVSRQPTTVAPTPLPLAVASSEPTVAPNVKRKVTLDMNGPIEPERVKQLMDKRDSSIYERPMNRVDRLPVLTDDYLPSERERLPSREPDRSRGSDRPGRFNSGQRYEVMINTSVMDAPSFNAKEVEELYVGDRVRVEARLGRWLKIRSRDGNPGYILAGDAEKLFD